MSKNRKANRKPNKTNLNKRAKTICDNSQIIEKLSNEPENGLNQIPAESISEMTIHNKPETGVINIEEILGKSIVSWEELSTIKVTEIPFLVENLIPKTGISDFSKTSKLSRIEHDSA